MQAACGPGETETLRVIVQEGTDPGEAVLAAVGVAAVLAGAAQRVDVPGRQYRAIRNGVYDLVGNPEARRIRRTEERSAP